MTDDRVTAWMADLEARHLADLTFPEVSRALRALSSTYVERRGRLAEGRALSGAGKRAAFALFYGPLHFLLVRHVVAALPGAADLVGKLLDLGCGTGASGAAWASATHTPPQILAVDRHRWAIEETRRTHRAFALRGQAQVGDLSRTNLPPQSAVLLAFTLNELSDGDRERWRDRLLTHATAHRGRVLVVEPLAGFVAPWWSTWQSAFESAGGRGDQWRFRPTLPPIVDKLDRAAGLNHREITGRTLWI